MSHSILRGPAVNASPSPALSVSATVHRPRPEKKQDLVRSQGPHGALLRLGPCLDGVRYKSMDAEDCNFVPKGLHCLELEICEEQGKHGQCPLRDSQGVVRLDKVMGIGYTFFAVQGRIQPARQSSRGC